MTSEQMYRIRERGVRWSAIALNAGLSVDQVLGLAKEYALANDQPWPVYASTNSHAFAPQGSPSLRRAARKMLDIMREYDEFGVHRRVQIPWKVERPEIDMPRILLIRQGEDVWMSSVWRTGLHVEGKPDLMLTRPDSVLPVNWDDFAGRPDPYEWAPLEAVD